MLELDIQDVKCARKILFVFGLAIILALPLCFSGLLKSRCNTHITGLTEDAKYFSSTVSIGLRQQENFILLTFLTYLWEDLVLCRLSVQWKRIKVIIFFLILIKACFVFSFKENSWSCFVKQLLHMIGLTWKTCIHK